MFTILHVSRPNPFHPMASIFVLPLAPGLVTKILLILLGIVLLVSTPPVMLLLAFYLVHNLSHLESNFA